MKTLLIKDFGPINNAEETMINIVPVTVFIGGQGTGKSTIAKLISEFSWIEKALERGDFQRKEIEQYNRFRKNYCAFHGIQNYFRENSYLRFEGDMYLFEYKNSHLTIHVKKNTVPYARPQIMYTPAERNLVSAIENAERIKRLPGSLSTLLDEYNRALRSSKEMIKLPLNGFYLSYDKLNKVVWLNGNGFKLRTHEAASGLQSVIPLSVVSNYLMSLVNANQPEAVVVDSSEDRLRMEKTIRAILQDRTIDDDIRLALLKELNGNVKNRRFINIVEEPEQNLFPISQRSVLYELLRIKNEVPDNELVFTTHSPYLINYLSLVIKAAEIQSITSGDKMKELDNLIPKNVRVKGEDVVVYETMADGSIIQVKTYEGMPSDDNALNAYLNECNAVFDQLLDIEENE